MDEIPSADALLAEHPELAPSPTWYEHLGAALAVGGLSILFLAIVGGVATGIVLGLIGLARSVLP